MANILEEKENIQKDLIISNVTIQQKILHLKKTKKKKRKKRSIQWWGNLACEIGSSGSVNHNISQQCDAPF